MTLPANKEIVLKNIKGDAMELVMEIDPGNSTSLELNVLRSPGKEEYTRIIFMKDRGMSSGRDYRFGQVARLRTDEPAPSQPQPPTPQPRQSLITIETSNSSTLPDVRPRGPETTSFQMQPGETLRLRVFIDKSVVEVFVNGKQALAARVYPGRSDSIGVSLKSQGQNSELKQFTAYQMKSIYE